jgi:hypothetical protein
MDCDDQVRLVKGNDYSHPNALHMAGESGPAFWIPILLVRIGDEAFNVRKRRAEASQFVLGMPR